MMSNHWCVFSTSPACQPQCKTFPLRDSPLGHILSSHTIFFTTSYLLSRHFANFPPGLPTCLPTLSFTIKSENEAFRLSYDQQPPHSEASSEEDSFVSISALRLDFHSIWFFSTPPADSFCKKHGSNINTIPRKDNFHPVSWISRGWEFFALVLHSPTVGRLLGERRCSAAPNFSSCALTY